MGFAKLAASIWSRGRNRKKGQGTVEYILVMAVVVAVGVLFYRVFEQRMGPILVNIKNKLEVEAQWGGRGQVNDYYVKGSGPYQDAQVLVDQGL